MYRSAIFLVAVTALAQQTVTQPVTFTVQHAYNVTSATQYIDNRSAQMQCNVITFAVTHGTGMWSVQLEYSDITPPGNWHTFGSFSTVTSTLFIPIGYGYGFHNYFRLNTTAGTTVANISCEKDFFVPEGISSGLEVPNFTGIPKAISGVDGLVQATASDVYSTLGTQSQGLFLASPATTPGISIFRAIVTSDLPSGAYAPATTGTFLLKGNGIGGFAQANSNDVNYTFPGGSTALTETTYQSAEYIDVRSFGATGVTGNCHATVVDDQPEIQAAINYAVTNGPADVFLPTGYCWPIQRHIWLPQGVHLHSEGRNFGSETSSVGALLIANANWASTNTTFPYSMMVWQTGNNATSGTFLASGANFGSELDHIEINCNDQVGCGNWFAVGRQEKARGHDLLLTGGVPFGSGGYSYGFFEQGVDCGGGGANTPPGNGCLIAQDPSFMGNAFSGQQGPDERIEIFPSYNVSSTNFIPWALMGANNYKGLRDSTINGLSYGIPYGEYFWGEETTIGTGIHTEGTVSNKSMYIGNIPAGSTCNGGSQDLFIGFDSQLTIANCGAQFNLTFINDAGGVFNNQTGAPVTTITEPNYFYDQSTQTSGLIGSKNPAYMKQTITLQDPAEYVHTGYEGLNFFNGTSHSGVVEQVMLDSNSVFTRGHLSSNLHWNHSNGNFDRGSNGTTGYNSVGFINGGVCLSSSAAISTPVSMATWLGNCYLVQSNSGHLLLGPGWLDPTTGLTVAEGSAAIQTHGGIGGDVQMASSASTTCPTAAGAGSTCTFTVPLSYTGYGSTPRAVCSLTGTITGSPSIQGVAPSTTQVIVTVQNVQAVASGTTGASCLVTP